MARSSKGAAKPGQLRIIGGRWRGRKLTFTAAEGLRPTADRVRETLFNWLAPHIHAAACLDLFAGSGALGLEALSRGAARCDFVDSTSAALTQIERHLETLQASGCGTCHRLNALQFLATAPPPYDIVFIDPPFGQDLIEPSCAMLADYALVATGGLVYVEAAAKEPTPLVPADWAVHREKVAGAVAYRLYIAGEGSTG